MANGSRFLLDRLSDEDRELVLRAGERCHFSNGAYIVRQGAPSDGLYIILQGTVETVYEDEAHRELTLSYWNRGDSVGAPNLLSDRPHIWSSKAIGSVDALRLAAPILRELIATSPSFAFALIGFLSFKAECYARLAQTLAMHSVERRLAEVLLAYGVSYGDSHTDTMTFGKVRQHDLAKMVGATRQSVSLALKRMQRQQLIEVRPTKIVLKQVDLLKRLTGA